MNALSLRVVQAALKRTNSALSCYAISRGSLASPAGELGERIGSLAGPPYSRPVCGTANRGASWPASRLGGSRAHSSFTQVLDAPADPAFPAAKVEQGGTEPQAAAGPSETDPALARGRTEETKNRRVFVTNLSYRATEEELRGFLEREGPLESVRIKYTLVDGARRSRGFATAVYACATGASSAIANLDDATFQGRKLKVREDNFSKLDKKSVANKNVANKVFIDFLDPALLWQDVKDHFQQTGNVYFVHLLWDQTRMHRQAVVEFGSPEEAQVSWGLNLLISR